MGVTVGGLHLEDAVSELQDGDIERTAAEVIDRDLHVLVFLVQAVSQSGSRRLVDDTLHVEACDLAGLLGGLTLGVGEVSGDGDDRLGHFLAQIVLRGLLHLLEDDGGNLLRRIQTAADVHARRVVVAPDDLVRHAVDLLGHLVVGLTHETLDREDGVAGVGDGLALGRVADLPLTAFGEGDDGRGGALTLVVDDDGRLVAFHDGDTRIGGAEVDSDNLSHIA